MAEDEKKMIKMLRKGYEAFNRGDYAAATAGMSDDVRVKRVGDLGELEGRDAATDWLKPDAFESQRVDPKRYEVNGDKVLVDLEISNRGRGSGIEMTQTFFQVWTFADGKVVAAEVYDDREEALEACGLK